MNPLEKPGVVERFPALIWHAGTDARCDYFNQAWLDFTGRSLEEELGDGCTQGVHPEDLPGCLTAYLKAFEARQPFVLEYRLRRCDGTYPWVSDHGSSLYTLAGEFSGYIGSCYDISHQKEVERELRQSQNDLEVVVEQCTTALKHNLELLDEVSRQMPGGIYQFQLFPDGRCCMPFVSQAMAERFAISPDAVRDDAAQLFQQIEPEDVPPFMASLHGSAKSLKPWHHEFRAKTPARGVRWFQGDANPQLQPDGSVIWSGYVTDITEHKLTETRLAESRFLLNEAQRIARLGSWSWVVGDDLVSWSDELYAITGRSRQSPVIVYADQEQLYTPDSWQRLDQAVQRALKTGESYELELELVRQGGEHRQVIARGEAARNAEGVVFQLKGTLQDVTEQKRLQQQLIELKKLEAIGQMASGVAHEVRNPLNAILTVTEALFRVPDLRKKPELEPYIRHIRTQVERLALLMNELLDFGRPLKQENLRLIQLAPLCRATLELVKQSQPERAGDLVLEAATEVESIAVLADQDRLQQVLINLLENAGQHSSPGSSITLQLAGQVSENGACQALIKVSDHGVGIAPHLVERVFEPFYSTRRGGVGLGLALVKKFVEQINGAVSLCDNVSQPGTTFVVSLPAQKGSEAA